MEIKRKNLAKKFLGLEELSPLETGEILGGTDKKKKKEQQQQKGDSEELPEPDSGIYV